MNIAAAAMLFLLVLAAATKRKTGISSQPFYDYQGQQPTWSLAQYEGDLEKHLTSVRPSDPTKIVLNFVQKHDLYKGFVFRYSGDSRTYSYWWNYDMNARCRIGSVTKPVIATLARKYFEENETLFYLLKEFFKYELVKEGHKCSSDVEFIGNFDTAKKCGDAVFSRAGTAFYYGKGPRAATMGECYWEKTNTAEECDEKFEPDDYDFYVVPEKMKQIADITVQQLITHKSGLTEAGMGESNELGFWAEFNGKEFNPDFVAAFQNGTLSLKKKGSYSYANINYTLLGHMVNKKADALREIQNLLSVEAEFADNEYALNNEMTTFLNDGQYEGEGSYTAHSMRYCGGLVARPKDLLKFARTYVLSGEHEGKEINQFDWSDFNWTHAGSMPGSFSILSQFRGATGKVESFFINFRQRSNEKGTVQPGDLANKLANELVKELISHFKNRA